MSVLLLSVCIGRLYEANGERNLVFLLCLVFSKKKF